MISPQSERRIASRFGDTVDASSLSSVIELATKATRATMSSAVETDSGMGIEAPAIGWILMSRSTPRSWPNRTSRSFTNEIEAIPRVGFFRGLWGSPVRTPSGIVVVRPNCRSGTRTSPMSVLGVVHFRSRRGVDSSSGRGASSFVHSRSPPNSAELVPLMLFMYPSLACTW